MRVWLRQQSRALATATATLLRSPLAAVFNVAVVGIALALPATLYVGLLNLQRAARAVSPEPQVTVFVAQEASREDVRELQSRLASHKAVARLRYVSREEALEEMKRVSGMAGMAESLGYNPLPDAFVVAPRETTPAALQSLRNELSGWPKVALVQVDTEWAQRLNAALGVGRAMLLLIAILLAVGLVAVTFNTIRLQILTQREEVEAATLIGATRGFIRRPFLYYGVFLGVLGGLAACAFVWAAAGVLDHAIADLARVYGAAWSLRYLAPLEVAAILGSAAVLGWLGAWLSVSRHLAETSPR